MQTLLLNASDLVNNPVSVRCNDIENYKKYAGCALRDDITPETQIVFFCLMLLCLALFAKAAWNLIIIYRIHDQTHSSSMKLITQVIMVFYLVETIWFFDGPLQLFFNTELPLYLYHYFEDIGVLLLNSILCIGGYVWITTILMITLNNSKKMLVNGIYSCLLILNFLFFVYFTMAYFYELVHDDSIMSTVGIAFTKIPGTLLMISTALNGIFFGVGCVILRGYLHRNWVIFGDKEGVTLSRLAIIGVCISCLRVLQIILDLTWSLPEMIKKGTTVGELWAWWWPIYGGVYLLIANILPSSFFLQKYAPNPYAKIQEKVRRSGADGGGFHSQIIRGSEGKPSSSGSDDADLLVASTLEETKLRKSLLRNGKKIPVNKILF